MKLVSETGTDELIECASHLSDEDLDRLYYALMVEREARKAEAQG